MRCTAAALMFATLSCVPAPAWAQRAGQLIAATPVSGAPAGTQAWRIRYWTQDDDRTGRQVTGMVVAPAGTSRQPRDVVAWTHGTWGVVEACAPSLSSRFFEVTPAMGAIAQGDVVVAPDYPGLGSGGAHPYLVGAITARSTLDAVRAARQIPQAMTGSRFAVWGESQGGHAALWTGQLAGSYAPDLTLVGVAADAPPTDLPANFRGAADPNAKAFLTGFTAYSWSGHYRVPLVIGRRSTPALIRRMAQKCISVDSTPKLLTLLGILTLRRDLGRTDMGTLPPWSNYAALNSVAPRLSVPVSIAQTVQDPLVSPAITRRFARLLCASGTRVQWIDLPGKDHATTARQSAPRTLRWLRDRFAGVAAPSDCSRI